MSLNRLGQCGGAGHLDAGRRCLKMRQALPRIGRTEKKAVHVIILLGFVSADKIVLSESVDSRYFISSGDFSAPVSLNLPLHFLLLGVKMHIFVLSYFPHILIFFSNISHLLTSLHFILGYPVF